MIVFTIKNHGVQKKKKNTLILKEQINGVQTIVCCNYQQNVVIYFDRMIKKYQINSCFICKPSFQNDIYSIGENELLMF